MASRSSRALGPAVFATAAATFASHVGSRATRDALFLSNFPATALPVMIMVSAALALALAYLSTRAMLRWGPGRVMPVAFVSSAALLLVEWAISFASPPVAAVLVYLHAGGIGALLISGFYSYLSERLDPRSAKRQLGQLTAAGTVGGLAGGLLAAQAGSFLPVAAMLPVLAAIQLIAAAAMARVPGRKESGDDAAAPRGGDAAAISRGADPAAPGGGAVTAVSSDSVRAMAAMPYIRGLFLMVLLVTIADVLVDLVLKGRAAAAMTHGGSLLQFFALFYAGVSLFTVAAQALASRPVLERLGPARSAAILPAGTAAAAAGALVVPGLSSVVLARGTQTVLMNSLFNAGYEVLFTPVPSRDKRAIKSLVDVGGSRAGDLLGAAMAQGVVMLAIPKPGTVLLALAIALSAAAFFVAYWMQRGYVGALARGLVTRAVHLDLNDATDSITRSTLLRTLEMSRSEIETGGAGGDAAGAGGGFAGAAGGAGASRTGRAHRPASETAEERRDRALRTRDPDLVRRALAEGPLPQQLIPRVVSLLAWDLVAREAIAALRSVGVPAIEPLVDPLLDHGAEFTIRRRVPLVLGTIAHPRAVQGLLVSLLDGRFEVRYRSGRALAHLLVLDPALTVPSDAAFAAVLHEVQTASGVWEGRRLLDHMDDEAWSPVMDELVRNRADQSLEHVFTLLALVLPRKPLRIAFRGLHTDDPLLRGTALEYLESVLPPEIRKPLWPFLEPERARRPAARPQGEALDELLRMNQSISIQLEELRRKE